MNVVVKTEYTNVDQEWLDWWLNRLRNEDSLPGGSEIVDELIKWGNASFTSKDPTSGCVGETTYEIIK